MTVTSVSDHYAIMLRFVDFTWGAPAASTQAWHRTLAARLRDQPCGPDERDTALAVLAAEYGEMFTARVEARSRGCWRWHGNRNHYGYGFWAIDGRRKMAHRLVYERLVGPIPDGWQVHHGCDRGGAGCVRPAHLFAVTRRTNLLLGTGRHAQNAAATTCVNGHPYDELNTIIRPNGGGRDCRECKRLWAVQYHQTDEWRAYMRDWRARRKDRSS